MDIPKFKALTIIYPNIANSILTSAKVCSPKSILLDGEVRFENTCIAVWDTGAMCSVITELTAQKLNLMPIDGTFVSGLGGTQYKNKYLVDITLPNGVEIFDLTVIELDNPTDQEGNKLDTFGLLIGMDIIARRDFVITNFEGKTIMSFREPSCYKVDYVTNIIKTE